MKLKQPSKDASSKIRMRASQDWVEDLILNIVRIYTNNYGQRKGGRLMVDYAVNELNRKGIYIIPAKKD